MRVLFLCDHLGYAGGARHGRTTYFVNVLPRLRRAGHDVSICVLRGEHPAAEKLRSAGVGVTFLNARRGSPRTLIELGKRIARDRVDVVHATQRESTALVRLLRLFLPSIPIVTHIVDSEPLPRFEMLLNRLLPQPDAALCVVSAVCPTAVRSYGIAPTRLQVLHNAVDLAALKPSAPDIRNRLRKEWGVAERASVVLSASRFSCEKRLDALIRMIPEVLKAVPASVFVMAGTGPGLESCRELAARLGVSHAIRFLGHRDDVADLLAAADAGVMLCQYEAFGNSAAEALAVGVPVVAYSAGGLAEVIKHEATGLLAPKGDDRMFVDNLVRLLRDSDLRRRLGARAREDAQRFAIDRHAESLIRTYSALLIARSNLAHRHRMEA